MTQQLQVKLVPRGWVCPQQVPLVQHINQQYNAESISVQAGQAE